MHAKSGLRVVLKWKIFRPDSVIAAVITFHARSGWRDARRCVRGSVQFHVLHGQRGNMLVPARLMLGCCNLALLGFYLLCLG